MARRYLWVIADIPVAQIMRQINLICPPYRPITQHDAADRHILEVGAWLQSGTFGWMETSRRLAKVVPTQRLYHGMVSP